ncbi:heterokaryon incompatibility protein-domain-containing protein [Tricladium varicosporioides]|nr:heterokaryon incompatibility protein-domain-containing protein [Hymenoscyphus varicosporioides]
MVSKISLSRLCKRCKVLQLNENSFIELLTKCRLPLDYKFTDVPPLFPGLEKSGKEGCEFCSFLRATLLSSDVKADKHEHRRIKELYDSNEELSFKRASYSSIPNMDGKLWAWFEIWITNLRGFMSSLHNGGSTGNIETSIPSCRNRDNGCLPRGVSVPCPEVLEPETVRFLIDALEECSNGHDECNVHHRHPFLPTRVLDLRDDPVRLLRSNSLGNSDSFATPSKYAALSYCWGSPLNAEKQLKTTIKTLEEHQKGILNDQMPEVLRDAIRVTRSLSIPFLWVDSLCIIQGDKADWEIEARKMKDVYGNAYVTLCPLISRSCLEGFLRRNPPSISLTCAPEIHPLDAGQYRLRFHRSWLFNMYMDTPLDPFSQDIIAAPWIRRGWTFQEAALSKRVILFGATATHFQCRKFRKTEGQANPSPTQVSALGLFPLLSNQLHDAEVCTAWKHIVSEYTRRKFTVKLDKPAALAGVAQTFKELSNDVYCSGIWYKHLHEHLLWRSCRYDAIQFYYNTYHPLSRHIPDHVKHNAPSWTWINCPSIDYTYLNQAASSADLETSSTQGLQNEIKQLELHLPQDEQSRYITGIGQEIIITSHTLPFPSEMVDLPTRGVKEANKDLFWQWSIDNMYFTHTNFDWYFLYEGESHFKRGDFKNLVMLLLSSGSYASRPSRELSEATGTAASASSARDQDRVAFGLLLYPADDPNKFYRVGTWHSFPQGKGGLQYFKHQPVKTFCVI